MGSSSPSPPENSLIDTPGTTLNSTMMPVDVEMSQEKLVYLGFKFHREFSNGGELDSIRRDRAIRGSVGDDR
jgi:hypothetical protein